MAGTSPRDGEGDQYDPSREPPSDLWKIAEAVAQLGALYFVYKNSEGAAAALQALAVLIELARRTDEPS